MASKLVSNAINAIREGKNATARRMLVEAIRQNSHDGDAWYVLASVVETDEQRIECLERALNLNSNNVKAKEQLAKLQGQELSEAKKRTMTLSDVLFSTKGRISLSKYWFHSLVLGIVCFSAYGVIHNIESYFGILEKNINIGLFSGLVLLVGIYSGFALIIKRCHDINRSGWFLILAFVPMGAFALLGILAFMPGTKGENKYGPDPKQI